MGRRRPRRQPDAARPRRVARDRRGPARVILDVRDIAALEAGEILVAPVTSPSWTPVFGKIGAAVSDIGGTMSHAAIVAREYGVPAVVGTADATARIKTGDRLRVDGDGGHGHHPRMSDARYDAVVAGGGHHGTIVACYLARAGLSVLVLERTAHLGGGASSSEGPVPGFLMNHCSHWTRFYGHPAYRDFNLHDEGLRYVFPEENEGMIFDDGSSFVGYAASRVVDPATGRQERSEENVRRTYDQIARFSPRDAETYLELLEAYERHWKAAFRRHRFSVPPAWGTPDALEALLDVPGSRLEPVHQFMTLGQLACDFFESPELRILFMRAATTSTGCFPDDVPGLQGLVHCIPLTLSFEPAAIAVGRQPGDQRRADVGRPPVSGSSTRRRARSTGSSSRTAAPSRSRRRAANGSRPTSWSATSGCRRRSCACCATSRSTTASGGASRTSTTTAASCSGPTSRSTSRPPTAPRRTTPASGHSRACTGARRTSTT